MSEIARRLDPTNTTLKTITVPTGVLPQKPRGEIAIDSERVTATNLRNLADLLKQDFSNLSKQDELSPAEGAYVQAAVVHGSRALIRTAAYRSSHKPSDPQALQRLQTIHASAHLYHNIMRHSQNPLNKERFSTANFGGETGAFPSYLDFATDTNALGAVLSPFTSHSAPLYDETLSPETARMPRHQLERIAGNVLGSLADLVEANGDGTTLDGYLESTLAQIAISREAAIDALQQPAGPGAH